MKYVDEFRDPVKGKGLLTQIHQLATKISESRGETIKLMEVCGGHTHAIFKFGLESLLPDSVETIHGPGCPVCILPKGRLDDAIALSQIPDVILTTFGDTMRVPGARGDLLGARARGSDIRMVYSPRDSLKIARENPDKEVIFLAIGFETTLPGTALTVLAAETEKIGNFSLFSNHVAIVPALEALLQHPDLRLDGFVGPGHVSAVIGSEPYRTIVARYHKPVVVSGFEPLDILQSMAMLLKQLDEGRREVENQYGRLVRPEGNKIALVAIERVFEPRDKFEWRGLGETPRGGWQLRDGYAAFDAEKKFSLSHHRASDSKACQCGEILKGVLKPWQCKVFGTACTPEHPLGACMVSSEGACAAYYRYGRRQEGAEVGDREPVIGR